MIYLALTPEEAVELLQELTSLGDKRLAHRLKNEIVGMLNTLDKLERNNINEHAQAWLRVQSQKIEEKKNDRDS